MIFSIFNKPRHPRKHQETSSMKQGTCWCRLLDGCVGSHPQQTSARPPPNGVHGGFWGLASRPKSAPSHLDHARNGRFGQLLAHHWLALRSQRDMVVW